MVATRRRRHQKSPLSGSEPDYKPSVWNKDQGIRRSHNCYSYATGQISQAAATKCRTSQSAKDEKVLCKTPQPGHVSGFPRMRNTPRKTCTDISARTMTDNISIIRTTFAERCPVGTSKIALATSPEQDYHYYRQDNNGFWSHKPGRKPVTNKDASGKLIINPEMANRDYRTEESKLNYDNFCGYMCVPRGTSLALVAGSRQRKKIKKMVKVPKYLQPFEAMTM